MFLICRETGRFQAPTSTSLLHDIISSDIISNETFHKIHESTVLSTDKPFPQIIIPLTKFMLLDLYIQ